ncbi:alpha/beta hydrolase fold domain-containing protein [Saccharicrinis sp. FJH54]|uniref:alpha/beta hydrolase fold domain-containing protein n=1 Tax=Saccharicrinis sp. FJH54 TaxID=3344665 RepID=UPI0035D4A1C1
MMRNRLLQLLFLFAAICFTVSGQQIDYPRDTSYNLNSALKKIKKYYPEVTLVKDVSYPGVKEKRNVVYYNTGERDLHADLFFPVKNGDEKIPAVILIHGGGWASGTKAHMVPLAENLAKDGYFAAAVEYRLSPEAIYPAGVLDLKTFVKWLKLHCSDYNIDTSRIATLGASAGATLAALVGTTGQNPIFKSFDFGEKVSDKVQAIVNIDGVVDFTDPAESAKDEDPAKPSAGTRWFGATYKQRPDLWKQASALYYAGPKTPPTIFINSSQPRFHAGRDEYVAILKDNGIDYRIFTIEGTPHTFWLFHPWFEETYPKVVVFLNDTFHYNGKNGSN